MHEYLSQIISKVNPKIVLSFGPDGTTGNPDHKKLGELVFNAVKENYSNFKNMRGFGLMVPLENTWKNSVNDNDDFGLAIR